MSAPGVSGDIGDLTTGVGSTATLVATARAVAHRSGLINDPFAEALVTSVAFVVECIRKTIADPDAPWYGVNFESALPVLLEK